MIEALQVLRMFAEKYSVSAVCSKVLDSPKFHMGIASAGHHPASHQTEGGLVVNTCEVAQAALLLAAAFGDAALERLALIAAIFHDYGKVWDYERSTANTIAKTAFSREVGHIPYGYAFFMLSAAGHLTEDDAYQIGHAILAHHGTREWGSVVEPQTKLAYLLHVADMISARGWYQ